MKVHVSNRRIKLFPETCAAVFMLVGDLDSLLLLYVSHEKSTVFLLCNSLCHPSLQGIVAYTVEMVKSILPTSKFQEYGH